VFSISNPHPDIFIVVKIDKILQGGICQTTEPYIRSTKDPRLGLRVHKTVKTCCQRYVVKNITINLNTLTWEHRHIWTSYVKI